MDDDENDSDEGLKFCSFELLSIVKLSINSLSLFIIFNLRAVSTGISIIFDFCVNKYNDIPLIITISNNVIYAIICIFADSVGFDKIIDVTNNIVIIIVATDIPQYTNLLRPLLKIDNAHIIDVIIAKP